MPNLPFITVAAKRNRTMGRISSENFETLSPLMPKSLWVSMTNNSQRLKVLPMLRVNFSVSNCTNMTIMITMADKIEMNPMAKDFQNSFLIKMPNASNVMMRMFKTQI